MAIRKANIDDSLPQIVTSRGKNSRSGRLKRIVFALVFILIGWFIADNYAFIRQLKEDIRFENNLYKLNPGMRRAEVLRILGKPEHIRERIAANNKSYHYYEYRLARLIFKSNQLVYFKKSYIDVYGGLPVHKRIWYRARDFFCPRTRPT